MRRKIPSKPSSSSNLDLFLKRRILIFDEFDMSNFAGKILPKNTVTPLRKEAPKVSSVNCGEKSGRGPTFLHGSILKRFGGITTATEVKSPPSPNNTVRTLSYFSLYSSVLNDHGRLAHRHQHIDFSRLHWIWVKRREVIRTSKSSSPDPGVTIARGISMI